MDKILSIIKEQKTSLKDRLWENQEYSSKEIIDILHDLFIQGRIHKERQNDDIIFSYNENPENVSADEFLDETFEKNADYHAVSRLARKFRGSRYKVTRDVKKRKILFSLLLEKKEKEYWILYCSNSDFFKKNSIFDDILKVDSSIRIVVSDNKVKMEILKKFDNYITEKFGSNGYVDFRKNNSFFILTEKEFFVRTTWKRLVG